MGQVIEQHLFSTQALENLVRERIKKRLGTDYEALKELNVDVIEPVTIEEHRMMARDFPQGLFVVKGLLGLDDSGVGMKYFDINIEQGMPSEKDKEVADAIAHQCLACVNEMKRDRKANPHKRQLILN